ncbi:MAG: hypothetical protein LZ172_04810 [Thaumarchaeota archaeon]|jgi:hypothetical protein|nr:hypothetical protein [Candidatus Geocrenenecus arthurdayi]MCL7388882.1 hypothetical protein [Candidatus Geocrenenecus arthurdayi]MCL7390556.1 hypothetical protein [Candidatus Geocrenenecus arthurdayi]MCL7396303.1 hypothetical protein [Candidatus Geocrenenecus arthurdayi]MCL7401171.1 hypothetical protein [Candidatus Geocrenenecus arthurdayi]
MRPQHLEKNIEELRHRVETLELAIDTILKKIPEIRISVEVPRVILEKKPVYVKVKSSELHGRIILLAIDGFLNDWKTAGDITSELVRRGWAPKDFKDIRPVLEHLVSLGLMERIRSSRKNRGRRAKWLYRAMDDLMQKVELVQ